MNENQKNELDNLDRENFGKLFDRDSFVSIDLSSEQVIVEKVYGFQNYYDLDTSDLSRAISNEKGDVKKYLIKIKQILL